MVFVLGRQARVGVTDLFVEIPGFTMSGARVLDRIESIEEEVRELKASVREKSVEMKGRLSGAEFDEEDFEEAEESLFNDH